MTETDLTSSSFDTEIARCTELAIVDFWAQWCGPCRMLAPVLEETARSRGDVRIFKVNVDEEEALAVRFAINAIPALLLFKGGKPVGRLEGYRDIETLNREIDEVLAG